MNEPLAPLLVRYGRMGDMVLQEPLLRLLHRRYGKPCTLLSFGLWSESLYRACPDVGTLWQLRLRDAPYLLSPQRWALVSALRRHVGPVYISEDIPDNTRRIRRLLDKATLPQERCLYIGDFDGSAHSHWVDRLLAFGAQTPRAWPAAAYPLPAIDALGPAPRLVLTDADLRDVSAWLAVRRLDRKRVVLLQPGNKRTSRRIASRQREDGKTWPIDRWAALVRAILTEADDFRVVLCGSAHEHALLEHIRDHAAMGGVTIATRDLPVRTLMALAACAHSMVSVDTGPAHVAAAVGCPLVVLYGAESTQLWDRRSPCAAPVVNLGGPPRVAVSEIAFEEVVAAWRGLAREPRRSGQ
ncbi:MAG: glycosyltransferase family 9 protein [Rudaea sp.]